MKIAVVGGGNIGTLLAAEFAHKGEDVVIYTSKTDKWSDTLSVLYPDGTEWFHTNHFKATNDLSFAMDDADQIWVVLPAFMFHQIAEQMLPFIATGQKIICVPGSGGAEFAFSRHVKKGAILCGLQRVHSIARLKQYGQSVYMLGRKPAIQLASIPASEAAQAAESVSALLDLPCEVLENYLTVTLTPSNPILHTTRIYSMFHDYSAGKYYDHNILFYEEWTDEASRLLMLCDAELQQICRLLPRLDLHMVKSLKEHYESDTQEQMTKKIRSIAAFKGLLSPMKKVEEGWIPDFDSRYFTADFSFGLKVLIEIGKLVGASTPTMNQIWNWYENCGLKEQAPVFAFDIHCVEKLYEIYR